MFVIAASPAFLPSSAQQDSPTPNQQQELTGKITAESATKIAIAVPPAEAAAGMPLTDAAEIGQVLRDDLAFSGWFGLLDPEGEGRIARDRLREPAAWGQVGAQYLALATLNPDPRDRERAQFRVRLVETGGGSALFERTWGGRLPTDLRRLAHVAADAIVEELTGRPGLAQTRIAFVAKEGKAKEVYLMDYDGARVRRLTATGTINLAPAWSPDSRRLTFLSFRGQKPSIYLLDENGAITTLKPRGGDLNSSPDFSPDGRSIVFSSDRDGNSELYIYDLGSGAETRLTHHPSIDTAPAWSPSGREIAFTSDRSGSPQIYIMSTDGSGLRRLTVEGRYNESAAWSPDGGRLAYVSRIEGKFEVVVHTIESGEDTVITSGPGNKENPRWAPDGRHLVFAGNRDGAYAIYAIRDDGTELRRLTRGAPAYTPDWSPIRR
ncbi:MAG: Tol-Pal system beta propeller repeat protein TolB [Acidobacteria bacterium]|nr:Tol-Pal system beta propeller repeat protein TolB [Acidobacteriota bacterium]